MIARREIASPAAKIGEPPPQRVKKGDDLASIAKELYIDVGDICIGTGLSRNQRLTPGMKLKFRALGCLRWKKSRL